jgi:hypothetical protein
VIIKAKRGRKKTMQTTPFTINPSEKVTFVDQELSFRSSLYKKGEKFLRKRLSLRVLFCDPNSRKLRKGGKAVVDLAELV